MLRNVRVATLNATLQLLVIYRYRLHIFSHIFSSIYISKNYKQYYSNSFTKRPKTFYPNCYTIAPSAIAFLKKKKKGNIGYLDRFVPVEQ